MLYTGIDLHKRTVVIATIDETGKVHSETSLPTSRSAVARYFHWLPEPTIATVEATSSWYWLRDLLEQQEVPLTLAHAKFVKAIAYAKVKTDAVDALTLSANVRETRSTQRIRVGRRQRKRICWDCEREWKRMVVPLEPGRPSEARQLLRTRR